MDKHGTRPPTPPDEHAGVRRRKDRQRRSEDEQATGAGTVEGPVPASARAGQEPFEGQFATLSEIVPTSEGVTQYGGADDWSESRAGVHARLDGWREHSSLPAIRRLIVKLRKAARASD